MQRYNKLGTYANKKGFSFFFVQKMKEIIHLQWGKIWRIGKFFVPLQKFLFHQAESGLSPASRLGHLRRSIRSAFDQHTISIRSDSGLHPRHSRGNPYRGVRGKGVVPKMGQKWMMKIERSFFCQKLSKIKENFF